MQPRVVVACLAACTVVVVVWAAWPPSPASRHGDADASNAARVAGLEASENQLRIVGLDNDLAAPLRGGTGSNGPATGIAFGHPTGQVIPIEVEHVRMDLASVFASLEPMNNQPAVPATSVHIRIGGNRRYILRAPCCSNELFNMQMDPSYTPQRVHARTGVFSGFDADTGGVAMYASVVTPCGDIPLFGVSQLGESLHLAVMATFWALNILWTDCATCDSASKVTACFGLTSAEQLNVIIDGGGSLTASEPMACSGEERKVYFARRERALTLLRQTLATQSVQLAFTASIARAFDTCRTMHA